MRRDRLSPVGIGFKRCALVHSKILFDSGVDDGVYVRRIAVKLNEP